jgi:Uncharacterized protein conserved in bacteria (DUF2252)
MGTPIPTKRPEAPRPTPEQRAALGKSAPAKAPLESHADFKPAKSRDPVGLLLSQAETRVPELVPIRHGRMLVSPFAFYRGAALIMAADLSSTTASGLRTQLCGDAHLSNFGAYASPERRLVFDINDFDETLAGPFEWDVKRLAASMIIAARENGFSKKQSQKAALAAVKTYRTAMRDFASQSILSVWYAHLNIEDALAEYKDTLSRRKLKQSKSALKKTKARLAKARTRDSLQAIGKLTSFVDGNRQIRSDPPLIMRLDDMKGLDPELMRARLGTLMQTYCRIRADASLDRYPDAAPPTDPSACAGAVRAVVTGLTGCTLRCEVRASSRWLCRGFAAV